jgi:hypothetical protein
MGRREQSRNYTRFRNFSGIPTCGSIRRSGLAHAEFAARRLPWQVYPGPANVKNLSNFHGLREKWNKNVVCSVIPG